MGNTTLSLYVLYNINYSNWVLFNYYDCCYPLLKNNLVFHENNLVNTPQKQFICFTDS